MPKQASDRERAASVLAFYGLDGSGSPAIVPPGYLPSRRHEGAPSAEIQLRKRLYDLARNDASAKEWEAAALQQAGLPLISRGDGKWKIDKSAVSKEEDLRAEEKDQQLAMNVRAFYGIDGQTAATVAPGLVPNQPSRGVDRFEAYMRRRLYDLSAGKASAGRWEAEALQQAEIPMLQCEDGNWIINKEAAMTEKEAKEVIEDQENAAKVKKFYGIDGKSVAIGEWGVPPSKWAPSKASSFEKTMRARLDRLSRGENAVGELEAEALQAAGLPVIEKQKGKFFIDREALREAFRQMAGASQDAGLSQGMGDMSISAPVNPSSFPVSMSAWDTSAVQDPMGRVGGSSSEIG
ncbi:hypothetical protein, partial [Streptomyces sp. NPDC049744]|uniref:hypothetical protein n=1 Tax=Streptomyces sp. NPDC049744 TaxID=3154359 RepID=UPI00342F6444